MQLIPSFLIGKWLRTDINDCLHSQFKSIPHTFPVALLPHILLTLVQESLDLQDGSMQFQEHSYRLGTQTWVCSEVKCLGICLLSCHVPYAPVIPAIHLLLGVCLLTQPGPPQVFPRVPPRTRAFGRETSKLGWRYTMVRSKAHLSSSACIIIPAKNIGMQPRTS